MTVPDRRHVTDALIALVAAGTGKACGDHKAPLGVEPPYSVVYEIPGGAYWGPGLVAPEQNADFVYQVDSVGLTRGQAGWLRDSVTRTMLARASSGGFQVALANPSGLRVADRVADGGPGAIQVEGKPPHEVFSAAERFVLRVVSA